jgi:hypothetical protein
MNHWNELVKVIDDKSVSSDIRSHATMLLNQLNTASGSRVKPEIESFLAKHGRIKHNPWRPSRDIFSIKYSPNPLIRPNLMIWYRNHPKFTKLSN